MCRMTLGIIRKLVCILVILVRRIHRTHSLIQIIIQILIAQILIRIRIRMPIQFHIPVGPHVRERIRGKLWSATQIQR